ncbi:MAG TPA: imidazolonepropionase [Alphaproteobacteria bacterium]|nr:imidazolonepropionase [Alphaproteobacteria bacterium]
MELGQEKEGNLIVWDTLWLEANAATMAAGGDDYGATLDAAIAVRDGRIAWIGPRAELPQCEAKVTHRLGGRWICPGLVDCHTHLVFAGERAGEFEQRLKGASYAEIARAGGGIRSTVADTRAASEGQLILEAETRLRALMSEGVTTVEIKSGYGLDVASECKMLRVARQLARRNPVTVKTTFLGAHALPPEYEGRQDDYIRLVAGPMLEAVARENLADAVDAFMETIGFNALQTMTVFAAAQARGLPVKLHADQLSDSNGAALAAQFGALSADHLEHTNEDGVRAMAAAGTVAVLLPGAFYFLREKKLPPVEAFRRHGVKIAIASDSNPGSSPARSLLLMLNMACTLFGLTPAEALAGVTCNAAAALGLADELGTLEAAKAADFVVWDIGHPAELSYWIGGSPARAIVRGGIVVGGAL